jgi:hypothetical protein
MVATGAFGLLRQRGPPHLWSLDRVGLIPSFWVKFDVPKRLGGNEKRFGCPLLNLKPNRLMQSRRQAMQAATVAAELGHMKPASVSRFRQVDARARFPPMTVVN